MLSDSEKIERFFTALSGWKDNAFRLPRSFLTPEVVATIGSYEAALGPFVDAIEARQQNESAPEIVAFRDRVLDCLDVFPSETALDLLNGIAVIAPSLEAPAPGLFFIQNANRAMEVFGEEGGVIAFRDMELALQAWIEQKEYELAHGLTESPVATRAFIEAVKTLQESGENVWAFFKMMEDSALGKEVPSHEEILGIIARLEGSFEDYLVAVRKSVTAARGPGVLMHQERNLFESATQKIRGFLKDAGIGDEVNLPEH